MAVARNHPHAGASLVDLYAPLFVKIRLHDKSLLFVGCEHFANLYAVEEDSHAEDSRHVSRVVAKCADPHLLFRAFVQQSPNYSVERRRHGAPLTSNVRLQVPTRSVVPFQVNSPSAPTGKCARQIAQNVPL